MIEKNVVVSEQRNEKQYVCEVCGTRFIENKDEAEKHEAHCLGLNKSDYCQYTELVRKLNHYIEIVRTDKFNMKLFQDCYDDLKDFEKTHKIKGGKN